jgi:hypothetical protein
MTSRSPNTWSPAPSTQHLPLGFARGGLSLSPLDQLGATLSDVEGSKASA